VTDTLHPDVQTYSVCSIPIAAADTVTAARLIVSNAVAGTCLQVHLCNAYTLSLVDRDPTLRAALLEADLNLADGTPVAWLGRQSGMTGPVRGSRLVGEVGALGIGLVHHYLHGGKEGVADRMADELRRTLPGISVVGSSTPPFRPLSDDDIDALVERVRDSGANVLWIGLGTPRQDYLVHRLACRLAMPIVPVGAAFDFWSGEVSEAPAILHGSGLEWLHRLASEPRRLWHRYLVGNPRFLVAAWRHRS
jgi:N-acetylglucosaminyldiphosphoundecaprenol N-acetyl-beta-D-mannosaminyltransferase